MDVTGEPLGLLTVKAVAERLSLSERSAWRLVHSGRLASVKVGAARRVTTRAVEDYINKLVASGDAA